MEHRPVAQTTHRAMGTVMTYKAFGLYAEDSLTAVCREVSRIEGLLSANTQPAAPAKGSARLGYVIAIVINIVLLYVTHHLVAWEVSFITPAWTGVLWAVDLSLGASIAGNVLFLVYDRPWFKHLVQIVMSILAFVSSYVMYRAFPFSFAQPWLTTGLRVLLLLGMVGLTIAVIADLAALITGKK